MNKDRAAYLSEQAAIFWPFLCAAVTIGFCILLPGRASWSAVLQAESVVVWANALVAVVGSTVARVIIDRKAVRFIDGVAFAVLAALMYSGPVAVYHVFTATNG